MKEGILWTLNVAILLVQMEMEQMVIIAGMFCDVTKKGKIENQVLEKCLSKAIADLVIGVNSMDIIQAGKDTEEIIEAFLPLANRLGNEKLIAKLYELAIKYV